MEGLTSSLHRLGRFEIVRELGRGAFGTVYLARDPQLERLVALKVPLIQPSKRAFDPDFFLQEARSAAALHHPNIVPVHDAGKLEGHYYIAVSFIEGGSLRDVLTSEGRPSAATACRLLAQLADALGYAHEKGIVHRDVKPENVLVDNQGTPYLADFGLAMRPQEIKIGQIAGTPAYMSPEQIAGQTIDGRSDQWALGVMFYELLVGQRPFRSEQIYALAANGAVELVSPKTHVPDLHPDLEAICLRCLKPDPKQRYDNCFELARDFEAWLNDQPVSARKLTAMQRLARWRRREPALAQLASLFLVTVTLFTITLLILSIHAYTLRSIAVSEAQRAQAAARLAEQQARDLAVSREKAVQDNLRLNTTMQERDRTYEELRKSYETLQKKETDLRLSNEAKAAAQSSAQQAAQTVVIEQQKNSKLKYFGEIIGAQLARNAGRVSAAAGLLEDSDKNERSIEWRILSAYSKNDGAALVLKDDYEEIDIKTASFIKNVHFPDTASDALHSKALVEAKSVVALDNRSRRWITLGSPQEILSSLMPGGTVVSNDPRYPQGPKLLQFRFVVSEFPSKPNLATFNATHGWISPDGRYACYISPSAKFDRATPNSREILIEYTLFVLDLDHPESDPVMLEQSTPTRYRVDVNAIANAGQPLYSTKIPAMAAHFDGAFSPESNQFILFNGQFGEITSWQLPGNVSSLKSIKHAASKRLPDVSETQTSVSACTFKMNSIQICLPGILITLDPQSLEVQKSVTTAFQTTNQRAICFSHNNQYVASVAGIASERDDAKLNIQVLKVDSSERYKLRVTAEQLKRCDAYFSRLNQPATRQVAAESGILAIDWSRVDFAVDEQGGWMSFQLPSGIQLFFERTERADFRPTMLWANTNRRPPVGMRLARDGLSLLLTFPDQCVVLRQSNQADEWNMRLSKSFSEATVMDATFHGSEDSVVVCQPDRMTIVGINTAEILKAYPISFRSSLEALTARRVLYLNRNGDVQVISAIDGQVTAQFRGQRTGGWIMSVNPDRKLIALGGLDKAISVWSLTENRVIHSENSNAPPRMLQLNLVADTLTSVGVNDTISLYAWPDLKRKGTFPFKNEEILLATSSNDGKRLLVVTPNRLRVLDVELSVDILQDFRFENPVTSALITPDQSSLFVFDKNGELLRYGL